MLIQYQNTDLILKKLAVIALVFGLILPLLTSIRSYADSSTSINSASINNLGTCGSADNQFEVIVQNLPSSGQAYIKLSNNQEPDTSISLYYQSDLTDECTLIGTATAEFGSWTPIGNLSNVSGQGGFIVATGDGLGAFPYSSVLSALIVTAPNICTPIVNCDVTYQGRNATLEPTIITHATDQIAVYEVKPINGVGFSKVKYFDNGQLLYSGTSLKPVNRNYLTGGVNSVDYQLDLNDSQVIDINQKINMGNDVTGMLYIRSSIYRSSNKALLFVVSAVVIILIMSVLALVRKIYKHHRFNVVHGIDKAPEQIKPSSEEPKVVAGKFK